MYKKVVLFIGVILCSVLLIAQTEEVSTSFYENYSDSLIIKIQGVYNYNIVGFTDHATTQSIAFSPNSLVNFGGGFNYKMIGISASFRLSGASSKKNRSSYFDYKFNRYGRKLGFILSYTSYKGYHVINPNDLSSSLKAIEGITENLDQPDMRTTILGVNAFYNLNHKKFSYRSTYSQSERQLKSAGSPLVGWYANRFTVATSDSSTILPGGYIPDVDPDKYFNSDLHIKSARSFNIGLKGGYAYTFVINKSMFLSLGLNGGVGYENSVLKYHNRESKSFNGLNLFGDAKLAFGYNSVNYFIGLSADFSNFLVANTSKYSIYYEQGVIRMVIAKRFSAQFLRNILEKKN